MREFLKDYEPYVDRNEANIYEWQENGVRFRLVVNEAKGEANSNLAQLSKPLDDEIITFYSDRNVNEKMIFKNKLLNYDKEHLQELKKAGNDLQRLANLAENGNANAYFVLSDFESLNEGRGYLGYSMSVNADLAQNNGIKPISKFNAKDAQEISEIFGEKISLYEMKKLLNKFGDTNEWHHTSKFYNKTPHYSVKNMFLYFDEAKEYLKQMRAEKQANKGDEILSFNKNIIDKSLKIANKANDFIKNNPQMFKGDDFVKKDIKYWKDNLKKHLNIPILLKKEKHSGDYFISSTFQMDLKKYPALKEFLKDDLEDLSKI